jgi:hypothetical protein
MSLMISFYSSARQPCHFYTSALTLSSPVSYNSQHYFLCGKLTRPLRLLCVTTYDYESCGCEVVISSFIGT